MRIWYARPMALMGTKEDRQNILTLARHFQGARIDFASLKECSTKKDKDMNAFFQRVDQADVVVAIEASEDSLSAGCFAEAQHARHLKIPVKVLRKGELKSVRNLVVTGEDRAEEWAHVKTY